MELLIILILVALYWFLSVRLILYQEKRLARFEEFIEEYLTEGGHNAKLSRGVEKDIQSVHAAHQGRHRAKKK